MAYTDGIVLIISASDHGLAVNPTKKEIVVFTNKHKPASFRYLKLHGEDLKFKNETRFLELVYIANFSERTI